jgi:hypothetical protein
LIAESFFREPLKIGFYVGWIKRSESTMPDSLMAPGFSYAGGFAALNPPYIFEFLEVPFSLNGLFGRILPGSA